MDKLKTLIVWLLLLGTLGSLVYFGHHWATIPAFFAFWFGGLLWDKLGEKRKIVDRPVTTLRGATMGDVQINGRIVGPTLKSPLTKRDSSFWCLEADDLTVAEQDQGDSNRRHLYRAYASHLVQVSDDTGTVWMRAQDIEWMSLKAQVSQTMTTPEADEALNDVFGKDFFNIANKVRDGLMLSAAKGNPGSLDTEKAQKVAKLANSVSSFVGAVSSLNPDTWSIDEYVVPSDQRVFLLGRLVSVNSSTPWPFKNEIKSKDESRHDVEREWVQAMTALESKEDGQPLEGTHEVLILIPHDQGDGVIDISTGDKSDDLAKINKSLVTRGLLFGVSVLLAFYAVVG